MLSYLRLENFKAFTDITLDLRAAHGRPKKVAFLYGENGSGKTSLTEGILFLIETCRTLSRQMDVDQIASLKKELAKRIQDDGMQKRLLERILHDHFLTLPELAAEYRMLATREPLALTVGFRVAQADGSYRLVLSRRGVVLEEELRCRIREREGVAFSLRKGEKATLSPSVFNDGDYRQELCETIDKYWGKHTFLAILFDERQTKNEAYLRRRVQGNLLAVLDWFDKLSVFCRQANVETGRVAIPLSVLRDLEKGIVPDPEDRELRLMEAVLNTFFTRLYTDIKAVRYTLRPREDAYAYELTFVKQVDGRLIEVPASHESTGTRKLLSLFPLLLTGLLGNTVFLDEMDNGIHDLLIKELLGSVREALQEALQGQLIVTTHNTLLLESLPPDEVYILHADAEGHKQATCLADYGKRLQKNHNLRRGYLRGDYEGIPYIGDLDLQELVEEIEEALETYGTDEEDGEDA